MSLPALVDFSAMSEVYKTSQLGISASALAATCACLAFAVGCAGLPCLFMGLGSAFGATDLVVISVSVGAFLAVTLASCFLCCPRSVESI